MIKRVTLLILFLTLSYSEPYTLGNGLQVGENSPIFIGGYISIEHELQDDNSAFSIDDIAFLSYGSYEKISYLAEFEFKKIFAQQWGETNVTTNNTTLYKERLYLQYDFDDSNSLRVGKFNNEVGLWNMTPINILRETTSNPELTNIIYPKFMTGLKYSYIEYSDIGIGYDVMFQLNENIDAQYNNYQIDQHGGLGVSIESESSLYKANIGYFKVVNGTHYLYYGLIGYRYDNNDWQVMGELGSQYSDNQFTTKYALYLQGLYRFNEHHSLILRGESFESLEYTSAQNMAIVGYTYRPLPPIAIKGEYQLNQDDEKNKFLFSFSVLF